MEHILFTCAWMTFATSLLAISYPYLIYPLLLGAFARFKQAKAAPSTGVRPASFTVLIPAHNEEVVIESKLENTLLACRSAGIPWQVMVVSDASTDGTCSLVRKFPQVDLVELTARNGIVGAFRAGLARQSRRQSRRNSCVQ
jgi:cellulose synthase/poly-beta-1,6-N-acetylglucosamine synthase-like glycosyltransferase